MLIYLKFIYDCFLPSSRWRQRWGKRNCEEKVETCREVAYALDIVVIIVYLLSRSLLVPLTYLKRKKKYYVKCKHYNVQSSYFRVITWIMIKNVEKRLENRWAHEFVFVWPWTISSLYVTFSHVDDDDRRWCCGESKYIFFVMVQTKKIFSMINTQTVYVLLVKISCILFTKYWRFIVLCCCVVPFLLLEIYHYFKNEKRVFFCQLCDGFVIVVDSHSYSLVRFEFPFF